MRASVLLLAGLVAVVGAAAQAETLPLPPNLIGFDSAEGKALLIGAEQLDDFFPLSSHFVTQVNPAFCGPATIAMVMNALNVARQPSDATAGFGMFDQVNVFDEKTEAVKPQTAVLRGGMTLDQLGGMFAAHDLKADVHHAADSSVDEFRGLAIAALDDAGANYVVVNYLRSALGQKTGGHISPLAAYDADTDRFLVLDVSRYKYPPIWVTAVDLFGAMNTPDADNADKTRGFLIVSR